MSSASSPEMPTAGPASDSSNLFSYIHATHDEVLEDLSSRFILNLPDEELRSVERISFQVEQAHWFYEDFIREQNPKFPSLPLKKFSAMLFQSCPLLHRWANDHEQAFNDFMQYKTRVPVCGAIMLNDTWEKCVLVKGWKSSSGWGFPKGKINEDEPAHLCAVREVLEETGYNLASEINKDNLIEMSIKEQKLSLFIVPNVPEDFPFKTKTRKEISKIEWFRLVDLPTWKRNKPPPGKFYLISPFIGPLKKFIEENRPRSQTRRGPKHKKSAQMNNNHIRRDVPPHITDGQESSSQTSSLDNGDPHTPSPQSSSAAPTVVQEQPVLDSEGFDPHFARLLSSLSLSAAAKPTETSQRSTPIPVMPDPSPQSLKPRTSFHSPSPLALSPSRASVVSAFEQPTTIGSEAAIASPTHSIASITSLRSRRTASTADISPYLPRSSEVPGSAKRMQQLALLESVADESAKIVSQQIPPLPPPPLSRPVMNGPAMAHYPLPPASVPPFMHDPTQLLYSSGHPLPPPPMPPHDPFQVRPWTSQAFHRGTMGGSSMSMSQGQLHVLLNQRGGAMAPLPAPQQSGPYPYSVGQFAITTTPRVGPPRHGTAGPRSTSGGLLSILNRES